MLHTCISVSTPSSASSEHKQFVYQPAQKRFSVLDRITVNRSFATAGLQLWSSVHYSHLRPLEKAYNHLVQLLLINISSIRYGTSHIFHLQSWWSKMIQINVKLAEPSFALRSRFNFSKKKPLVETHMWRAIEMASSQFCPRCSRMVLHCVTDKSRGSRSVNWASVKVLSSLDSSQMSQHLCFNSFEIIWCIPWPNVRTDCHGFNTDFNHISIEHHGIQDIAKHALSTDQ